MAKLTHEQIAEEIKNKGYELVDDSKYSNMSSEIIVKCPEGHYIATTLKDFRHPSFMCPKCDKNIVFINPKEVPNKKGYRLIAFDQATEKFGLSIFENGELIYYRLLNFRGVLINRLKSIADFIQDIVIKEWQPDFIIMEDIQYQQNGIMTFKVLAMLLGIIQEVCFANGIEYDTVSPNVWRKYAGTCGKTRREEKLLSVGMVKDKFGISVSDDIAEAILIGKYGVRKHPEPVQMALEA